MIFSYPLDGSALQFYIVESQDPMVGLMFLNWIHHHVATVYTARLDGCCFQLTSCLAVSSCCKPHNAVFFIAHNGSTNLHCSPPFWHYYPQKCLGLLWAASAEEFWVIQSPGEPGNTWGSLASFAPLPPQISLNCLYAVGKFSGRQVIFDYVLNSFNYK